MGQEPGLSCPFRYSLEKNMLINLNQTLSAINGETLKDNDGKGNVVDATLKMILVNALLAPDEKSKNESGMDKVAKYRLATKIYENDSIDITSEDITLLKKRVGDLFGVLVVGQVYDILEGKTND